MYFNKKIELNRIEIINMRTIVSYFFKKWPSSIYMKLKHHDWNSLLHVFLDFYSQITNLKDF